MILLIDMNLSPSWREVLQREGWDSVHWSVVGMASAPDHEIMHWARKKQRVVLTHDLDYGAILAATRAAGPSVVQVRTQDVRPRTLAPILTSVLRKYERELEVGALLIVDQAKTRIRLLPFPG